jgi:hypothetical protein
LRDEPDAVLTGQLDVRREVRAKRFDTARVVQEREGGELRQLEPGLVDQPRLHAAVGEEEVALQLREHAKKLTLYAPSLNTRPSPVAK